MWLALALGTLGAQRNAHAEPTRTPRALIVRGVGFTPTFTAFSSETSWLLIGGATRSALCLGAACATRLIGVKPRSGVDETVHVIRGLGPLGTAALGLFAAPTLKDQDSIALRLSPMLTLKGGGVEMCGVWW